MPIIFIRRQALIVKTRDVEISFPNENEHSPCRILLFDRNKPNAVKNHLLNAKEQKTQKNNKYL